MQYQNQSLIRSEDQQKQNAFYLEAQVNIYKQKLQQKKIKHLNEMEILENESYAQIKALKSENLFLSS